MKNTKKIDEELKAKSKQEYQEWIPDNIKQLKTERKYKNKKGREYIKCKNV